MRAAPIQTNFTGGEWAWSLQGRVDLPKYGNSCRRMRNMMPKVQGPAYRRGGTGFVYAAKAASAASTLIPFEFSTTQAYILEFSNLLFRIFKDRGIVLSGTPVEVVTTYAVADLPAIKWAQSADTLYLAHRSYPPRKITRTSHTAWTITTIAFEDGPYMEVNETATQLTLSGTTGSVTVTASAVTGINSNTGFQTTDVGRLIRWKDPANNWTWLLITARTSTTVVTALISGANASAATATINWRLGTWSGTTGYPSCVTFFQDRLVFAGEPSQRIDMSVSGDYEHFRPSNPAGTVADDDAIAITLNANDVNVIRALSDDEKALIVLTVGGEWLVRASTQGNAIVATEPPQATRSTTYGCADFQPLRVDYATLFVQRSGFELHEHAYSFEADGFRTPNLSTLSEELPRSASGGITRLAYQQNPDRIVWMLRADGRLIGMTYDREQEVIGWHLHTMGGYSDSGSTIPAMVESIAVIPSPDGTRDDLWLCVKRYINGGVVRYIEYMQAPLGELDDQEDAKYLDSGVTYDSTPVTTVTGVTHLIGQTVRLLVDGATHPDVVVDGAGEIDLELAGSVVQVGLPFESILETQNLEAGSADGTAQAKTKRIEKVFFRVNRSRGGSGGPDDDTLDPIPGLNDRLPSTPMGQPPPLITDDVEFLWPAGYEKAGRAVISTDGPLPLCIVAYMPLVSSR